MKANELTAKILLSNGFKETENGVYECFLQADHRLYMFYNYLESRWSVWRSSGGVKQHLGYCKTVEQLNELLQKNNIDKEIIIELMTKTEKFIHEHTNNCFNYNSYAQTPIPWLTPDEARKAVEIAREEILLEVAEWIKDTFIFSENAKKDFSQTFNIKLL